MTYKFIRRAIALEYGDNPAPILSAKGEDELAEAIIAEAKKRGVHIAEDPLRAVARGTSIALKNIDKYPFLMGR